MRTRESQHCMRDNSQCEWALHADEQKHNKQNLSEKRWKRKTRKTESNSNGKQWEVKPSWKEGTTLPISNNLHIRRKPIVWSSKCFKKTKRCMFRIQAILQSIRIREVRKKENAYLSAEGNSSLLLAESWWYLLTPVSLRQKSAIASLHRSSPWTRESLDYMQDKPQRQRASHEDARKIWKKRWKQWKVMTIVRESTTRISRTTYAYAYTMQRR